MVRVPPAPTVTESVKLTVAAPQASTAVATPVLAGSVLAGHSSTLLGGQVIVGGVVSTTSIRWTHVAVRPASSVAFQVRRIVRVPAIPAVTESVKVTVAVPQASRPVATPVLAGSVLAGHSSTLFGGQAMVGGVVSTSSIFCTQVAVKPQASVAVHVREMVFLPPPLAVTTSANVMATKPQVSWP